MPNAKKDDVNIVQIESEGFNQEKVCFHIDELCSAPILMRSTDNQHAAWYSTSQVKVPVLAMRGGTDLQTYVDILVPTSAKLTLIKVFSWMNQVGGHC